MISLLGSIILGLLGYTGMKRAVTGRDGYGELSTGWRIKELVIGIGFTVAAVLYMYKYVEQLQR